MMLASTPARVSRSPASATTSVRSSGRSASSASTNRISTSAGGCCRSASPNRELGNDAGLGRVTFLLGPALFEEGRFEEARDTFEQAAAIFTELGRRWEATNAEIGVAYALIADGEDELARPILEEVLRTAVDLQSLALVVQALVGVASIRSQTEPGAAVRLLSAAWTV